MTLFPVPAVSPLASPCTGPMSKLLSLPCSPLMVSGREVAEYKYVVVGPDGYQDWQDGPNLAVSPAEQSSESTVLVTDSWVADGPRSVQVVKSAAPDMQVGEEVQEQTEEVVEDVTIPESPPEAVEPTPTSEIQVTFAMQRTVAPEQQVRLVGGCPALGNWTLDAALPLEQTEDGLWTGSVSLLPG